MLPARHRMRQSHDFRATTRQAVRVATPRLVVHYRDLESADKTPGLVGFIVSKAVGNAVTRNLVKRRLRALIYPHLGELDGVHLVIRALPAAAHSTAATLANDLERTLRKARRKAGAR